LRIFSKRDAALGVSRPFSRFPIVHRPRPFLRRKRITSYT
jgi:hypothetical protein